MNNTEHTKAVVEHNNHKWQGYTIDQLEQRIVINRVKSDLIKEQMGILYQSSRQAIDCGNSSFLSTNINSIMSYAAYGIQAVKYVKNFIALYKQFKSTFGNFKQQTGV